MRDFGYVYLDDGMGCAIISDAEVRRGAAGLAGEIAHLITAGPRRPGDAADRRFRPARPAASPSSTAIDVDRLLAAVERRIACRRLPPAHALGQAMSGVLAAVVALAGARADALDRLRAAIVAAVRGAEADS